MTEDHPNLPGLYELVVVDEVDSARAQAERLAAAGADEGVLVWAKKQSEGSARRGKYWISGSNNLHAAVILRPDFSLDACCQLSLVAAVSACQAVTLVGEPMEELRLGWPNDIYLNRGKVGAVHLSGALSGDRVEWLVVSVNLNTFDHPPGLGFKASSLRTEGFERHARVDVLEAFAREFLAWLNRWADDGLEPVRRAWLWRGDWRDEERRIEIDGKVRQGMFDSLGADGSLNLHTAEGIIKVGLLDYFRPEFRAGGQHSRDNEKR